MTILVALLAASGITLTISSIRPIQRRSYGARVEPYLGGLHGRPSLLLRARQGRGERLLKLWESYRPGSSARDSVRLRAAGLGHTLGEMRLEQATWGVVSGVGALFLTAALNAAGGAVPAGAIATFAAICFLTGVLARDWWLTKQVDRRTERMLGDLPTAIDLLTISLMSGESVPAAIERVADMMPGDLGHELMLVVEDVRSGDPLVSALDALKLRVPDHSTIRLVDALVTGMEKGAPLADVLAAQAADMRDTRRRVLLELGGRREVLMLVPVVFLIMPVVILFALWPGLMSLDLLVP